MTQMALNELDIVELFGANMTNSFNELADWIWTDCNLWDGNTFQEYLYAYYQNITGADVGLPGIYSILTTDPKYILTKILNDRKVNVLVMNGDLDFHINYYGTMKIVRELEWYGQD